MEPMFGGPFIMGFIAGGVFGAVMGIALFCIKGDLYEQTRSVGRRLVFDADRMGLGDEARTAVEAVGTALADDGEYDRDEIAREVADIMRPAARA
jgi:hypothetical protein